MSDQATVRVLLVEDDEDDFVLTRQMLADAGPGRFEIEWVPEFVRGLDQLCENRFDVCLVDYRLDARNGVEFVAEATRRRCGVPIILLTGMGDHSVDLAAMNAGAADYLSKETIDSAALERSIRYALQKHRAEEQRIRLLTEKAARERAEAANEAKDHFLAALSHELRTPLTPVLIAIASLEQEALLPPHVQELLALIHRNIDLEARLIDDLLDLTRVVHRKLELRRERTDVHEQLKHALVTSQAGLTPDKAPKVVIDARADAHYAIGDPARLQQVFWNLLNNAIKFTPTGGEIVTRTFNDGGDFILEVADTGVGIAPEALPRIFNAFEQGGSRVTRQFGGLGLGLAICKALVELHGGRLSASSAGLGCGSTFTVRIPAAAAASARGPEPSAVGHNTASDLPGNATGRILLVEDHADTRRLMSTLLERSGHQVTAADSVSSALATARQGEFDLVISDIGLPDGSGLEMMRRLLEERPIKGIALSGYGMESDIQQSMSAGFAEHLTKPVDLRKLQEIVGRLLRTTEPA